MKEKTALSCVVTGRKFHNPKLSNVEFYGTFDFLKL